jgi:3'-5' exoribonuclease
VTDATPLIDRTPPVSYLPPNSRAEAGVPAPPDLKLLAVGDRVQDPLLVLEVEQRDSPRGAFTTLTFGNCRGRLTSAPFWAEDQPRIAGVTRGDVAQVIAEVTQYNGRRQLKVTSIRVLPRGAVDWRLLLPSVSDVGPYWERLDRWRGDIGRSRLRRTLDLFYTDDEFRRRYEACPASTSGHHAELGGLLRHTCEVAAIGRAIAKVCRADQELVLAGALLHDIGKLEAYRWDGAFETTECGALLGHVVLGMLELERRVRGAQPAPCTDQELTILHHLIASHHGRLEYGAAAPPMTLEAEVLHFADNASAKTAIMAEALAEADNFTGAALLSARTIWQLDRRKAYRGASDWGAESNGSAPGTEPSTG